MLTLLRQIARALTGKADPFEFSLGIYFGILLALIPSRPVDPATGFLGMNALWLLVLVVFLVLRASIPIALLSLAAFEGLGILFLDSAGAALGRSMIENVLPQGLVRGLHSSAPSLQLHTYWGLGGALMGLLVGVGVALPLHFLLRAKLPLWRERFGRSRFAKALSGFFLFRILKVLTR